MTGLTTHILDTAKGRPAPGITVRLYDAAAHQPLAEAVTDANGRALLVADDADILRAGVYELIFAMGPYFGNNEAEPAFLGDIVLRFGIDPAQPHYHIPLLVSPWSYTTYRGS